MKEQDIHRDNGNLTIASHREHKHVTPPPSSSLRKEPGFQGLWPNMAQDTIRPGTNPLIKAGQKESGKKRVRDSLHSYCEELPHKKKKKPITITYSRGPSADLHRLHNCHFSLRTPMSPTSLISPVVLSQCP